MEDEVILIPGDNGSAIALPQDKNTDWVSEDSVISTSIRLPSEADVPGEAQVLRGIKDVFRHFTGGRTILSQFNTAADISTYVANSFGDIKAKHTKMSQENLCVNAACMARLWYLGDLINAAVHEARFGDGLTKKIADAVGVGDTYIYQIRNIANRLTIEDCYLLGFRGFSSTSLRRLAQVPNDDVRKACVKAFIDRFEQGDPDAMHDARRMLMATLNNTKMVRQGTEESSDPTTVGAQPDVSPEYQQAMTWLNKWKKMVSPLMKDKAADGICNAMADFYITDTIPGADHWLAQVQNNAESLKKQLSEVRANIDDIITALDSVQGVTVQ